MGRICAWCGAFLSFATSGRSDATHALCSGCLDELRAGLETEGVRLEAADD